MNRREMSPRERILAAIEHRPTDAVPTDYWGVPEITEKLYRELGVTNILGFAKALDMDKIMTISPTLKVPRHNMWNIEMRRLPLPSGVGYYEEPLREPLADCESIADIEKNYTFPSVDMYDYSDIPRQCELYQDYAIEGGYISLTYFYEMIRGTENMLMDMIAEPEIAEYIYMRLQEFAHEHTRRILEAGDGRIMISQVTDDMGSQRGLLCSPEMFDSYLRNYYDENIAMVKSFGAKVFHHNDGAMTAMLPWLMDRGIEVLNPIQWRLPGFDLQKLKTEYGSRLCFHGGVDNQWVMPFGTEKDVRAEVRCLLDALYCDRTGFILAPCHNIQAITSVANVLAMYDEAHRYTV